MVGPAVLSLMALAQEAASHVATAEATYTPFLPSWMILLPFLGFLINGALAFLAPERRKAVSIIGPSVLGLAALIALVNLALLAAVEEQR